MQPGDHRREQHIHRGVSILIQPEGRMQHFKHSLIVHVLRFQSSSSQKAGCNAIPHSALRTHYCFNPHPARRPDATCWARRYWWPTWCFNPHPARRPDATAWYDEQNRISALFQSSSSQKAGCNKAEQDSSLAPLVVSILIQPEGRMQRRRCSPAYTTRSFNPHPARRPDATSPLQPSIYHA